MLVGMGRPQVYEAMTGLFFDATMDDGAVYLDDGDWYMTRETGQALWASDTMADLAVFLQDKADGEHLVPRQLIQPYEGPAHEDEIDRRSHLNTVTCPECSQNRTRLRRWYLGAKSVWWCDSCVQPVPTLRLVR